MTSALVPISEEPDDVARQIKRYEETNWVAFPPDLKAFAYSYLEDYDHRRAAVHIGRSPNSGASLIRNPLIASYISYLQEKRAIPNIITEDFVRAHYLDILPKLLGKEEIPYIDKDGIQVYGLKFDSSAAISVLKELGKSNKFYENGSGQGSGQVSVNINFDAMLGKPPEIVIDGQD